MAVGHLRSYNTHYHLTSPVPPTCARATRSMPITPWCLPICLNRCAKGLTLASAAVLAMFGMAASAAPTKEPDMVPTPSVKPASVENPTTSASQADEFRQFLESIWPKADAAGVSRATFDNAISGLTPDSAVLEKSANQADFTITIARYLTQSVSAEGAALGHDLAASLSGPLEKIQARSGVPSEILVALWGLRAITAAAPAIPTPYARLRRCVPAASRGPVSRRVYRRAGHAGERLRDACPSRRFVG